jgi:hypothetical protein
VGAADAVRAGEHDEVVDAEPLRPEAAHELGQVEEGRRQEGERLALQRDVAVEAPAGEGVVDPAPAEEEGGIAAGELDDVEAGDDAGAGPLDRRLGRVDHLEAGQAGEVGRAELLRTRVRRRRVQQNGRVTALHHQPTSLSACWQLARTFTTYCYQTSDKNQCC